VVGNHSELLSGHLEHRPGVDGHMILLSLVDRQRRQPISLRKSGEFTGSRRAERRRSGRQIPQDGVRDEVAGLEIQ